MGYIRLQARQLFKKKDGVAFPSLVIYILGMSIAFLTPKLYIMYFQPRTDVKSFTDIVLGVAVIIVAFSLKISLRLSFCRYYLKKARGMVTVTTDTFYYLIPENFPRATKYIFVLALYKAVCFFVCFLPGIASLYAVYGLLSGELSLTVMITLSACALLLLIAGGVCYFRLSSGLFLCDYLFVKDDFYSLRNIFSDSQGMMKRYTKRLIKLKLSFAGWFVLCLLIVPALYVYSYYRQTAAVFASNIIKNMD